MIGRQTNPADDLHQELSIPRKRRIHTPDVDMVSGAPIVQIFCYKAEFSAACEATERVCY
jgi:tRNA (Thr-GGU) A37 N-methylase